MTGGAAYLDPTVVVLLDADGVVLPFGDVPAYPDPPVWFNFPQGRMHVRRPVIGWLQRLGATTKVVWLTTWQDEAQSILGPALGLPMWGFHARTDAPRWTPQSPTSWWKEAIVRAYLEAGYRVAWADDDIDSRVNRFALARDFPDAALLCVSPSSSMGLSKSDMDTIDAWIAA